MKTIEQIKQEALDQHVPIMEDDGIDFLCDFIQKNEIQEILEIGSGIGYSSIRMAMVDPKIRIVTIEKDEKRYAQAYANIQESGYGNQIESLLGDGREYIPKRELDMVFIDAAKVANEALFQHLTPYLKVGGYAISDDIYFHGFIDHPEEVRSPHFLDLVNTIKKYRKNREEDSRFDTQYYDVGDGILISKKK